MSASHINHTLDNLIRPHFHGFGRKWSSYLVCGFSGLILAVAQSVALVNLRGLSAVIMAGITLGAVITFLVLAFVTKVLTGKEALIYYHHEIAVLLVSALLLHLTGQPVWAYLEITILGIGTFLVCGRLGCLMVGCCHGRPYHWGVCYTKTHASLGFTPYYVGVRLFPIQALEMVWVLGIVLVGIYKVLTGQPPGTALAWYVIAYDIGRFGFEFMRGDPVRPYYLGFSEAQWISVVLMAAVAALELAGILPLAIWHLAATAFLVLILWGLSFYRRWEVTDRHRLLSPPHIRQIVRALGNATPNAEPSDQRTPMTPDRVQVASTTLGLQISTESFKHHSISGYLVTLSLKNGRLPCQTAQELSRSIAQLKHWPQPAQILRSRPGVFHLMFKQ